MERVLCVLPASRSRASFTFSDLTGEEFLAKLTTPIGNSVVCAVAARAIEGVGLFWKPHGFLANTQSESERERDNGDDLCNVLSVLHAEI